MSAGGVLPEPVSAGGVLAKAIPPTKTTTTPTVDINNILCAAC